MWYLILTELPNFIKCQKIQLENGVGRDEEKTETQGMVV